MSLVIDTSVVLPLLALLVSLFLATALWNILFNPLRNLPGPFLTRCSGLYRLSMVAAGKAPAQYRQVHNKYGKLVRVAPNQVSISDPAEIPTIYGLGSKFMKTPFYSTMTPIYKGQPMDSMFTERDPVQHKALKTPVAQLFSMTNMRNYEPYTDECTELFTNAMEDLEGQTIDLAAWLQWYAFDVIGSITFQRRFGFLERRTDVDNMIKWIDDALHYVKVVSQFPALHPYLMGNRTLIGMLNWLFPNLPDPLARFLDITEEEVRRYDENADARNGGGGGGRTDFLAQLRAKEAKDGKISQRDIMNHLSNNLLAGSDTTAISLRACFYYIIKTPSVYQRLQAEIDEAEQNGRLSPFVTYQESLQLPYLYGQATIKEAMRMHPGVGFPLERYVPPEGATICNTFLPGGTIVSMSAPVLHADTGVYGDDALQFRPERWLDADPERLRAMERSFLSFGYGARTCIGKNISLLEMGKFIPQIFRRFDVLWAKGPEDEWKLHAAWFWKQSGIDVVFRRRRTTTGGDDGTGKQ